MESQVIGILKRRPGQTWLALGAALAALPAAAPVASPAPNAATSVDVVHVALAEQQKMVGTPWRTTLAAGVRAMPELRVSRTLHTAIAGRVLADRLHLPRRSS